MATREAIAIRAETAMKRIEAVVAALMARRGLTITPAALRPTARDPDLARAMQAEALADALEAASRAPDVAPASLALEAAGRAFDVAPALLTPPATISRRKRP